MDGAEPTGGRWNLDHDNREPPPRRSTLGLVEPWCPVEDEIGSVAGMAKPMIVLLRGINVGGHNTLPRKDLRGLLEGLGR